MRQVLNNKIGLRTMGNDQGSVIVELALILPFLALLIVAIINLGLVVREHQVIQNAAREGAHFSSLEGYCISCSQTPTAIADNIKSKVITYLNLHMTDVSAGTLSKVGNEYRYPISVGGTNAGTLTIFQQQPIAMPGGITVYGSKVTITYTRSFLIPGAPILPFNSLTLTGNSVFRNFYGL